MATKLKNCHVGADGRQSESQSYRERTQSGMPSLNEASNQRQPARAARKKRRAGRGRPPAKLHETPLHDPPVT
eukprot:366557-Chlamydomonas_euryale.AAC.10